MGYTIKIEHKHIGHGHPVFVIAEAGVNHNGDFGLAKKLIDAAALAGADAIKFQTFTPELLVTHTAPQAEYQIKNTGKIESQFEMLKRLELPHSWHSELQSYSRQKGLIFLSTPFSEYDADFLDSIDVPAFKIPSGEITNIPYLAHIAQKGKLMIVSSGMATMEEVKEAVAAIRNEGNEQIVVLHSTSNYPPSLESLNLKAIQTLQKELQIPIGYSDNGSPGIIAAGIAVGLGACIFEKHFTLDKNLPGPDHKASLDPTELAQLVQCIRDTGVMLGSGEKNPTPEEAPIAEVARKSVVAARNIKAGSVITREDLTTRRPGTGYPPKYIYLLVGKVTQRDVWQGVLISPDDYVD
jgi:N-acetylneuraminate synthase/N,N'-diacetyllegionaminate synthase